MNYFCDSGGVIFHVDPERVFQGSANANVINFFGAFPSNAEVLIAYQLPDGTWTTPQRMTPIAQLSGVLDGKGNAYAGWQTRIGARLKMSNGAPVTDENGNYVYEPDYTITAQYGTVGVQFFAYANAGNGLGAQIATAISSFLVEKGVPIVLPDTPTDDYEVLLGQILAAISDKNLQIDTNAENISQNAVNIAKNATDIAKNAENISTLQTELGKTNANVAKKADKTTVDAALATKADKTTVTTLETNLSKTESIAKGAQQAISYADYQTMIAALNALDVGALNIGQSIYIRTLNVPDLWVDNIYPSGKIPYEYTTDEDFVAELKADGYVLVGHYYLAPLETGKVDLTDYPTKADLETVQKILEESIAAVGQQVSGLSYTVEDNRQATSIELASINQRVTDNENSIVDINATLKGRVTNIGSYMNKSTYTFTIELLDADANILDKTSVNLPLESMVVSGSYDDETKSVVLTLQSGETVSFPIADLVDGLISSTEKGQPNGIATLGADGKVPSDQLPAGQGGAPDLTEYVKFTDIAKNETGKAGTVLLGSANHTGLTAKNNQLELTGSTLALRQSPKSYRVAVLSDELYSWIKYGIVDNDETLTDEEKTSACDWLGAVKQLPTAASGEKAKLYSNKYNHATQGYDVQVDNYNQAGKYSVPTRADNGAIYIPDTACVANGAIPEGQVAVNANYVDENAGTKWYKHVMSQTLNFGDQTMVYDWLIVSTRETDYTSGSQVITDWKNGTIQTFFNSSLGEMGSKITYLDINNDAYGIIQSSSGVVTAKAYTLTDGTLSYREPITKL